jgi:hypothetical protein
MPRFMVTWEARPLAEFGRPMGSTVIGQEYADFETIPEGIATDAFSFYPVVESGAAGRGRAPQAAGPPGRP